MRKLITSLVLGATLSVGAHATLFTVGNTADTYINATSVANANTAYNGDLQAAVNGSKNQVWLRFSGSAIKASLGSNNLIQSIGLQISIDDAVDNTDLNLYFNSNGSWQVPSKKTTGQNAATTSYLTWNDSGQSGATNSRFLGTTSPLGTYHIASRNDVLDKTVNISLSGTSPVEQAIASGNDFSILMTTSDNMRAEMVMTEGVTTYRTQTSFTTAAAPSLNIEAVPEPTTIVTSLGLFSFAIIRRRRSA